MPFLPIKYNPTQVNEPPTAEISPISPYIHIGEQVTLIGNTSSDPEQDTLSYIWEFINIPVGSQLTGFTSALSDRSIVFFVPDVVGIYEVILIVNDGRLDSAPVKQTFVCRQLPIPHSQSFVPDMRWMFSFIRDWITQVEDRHRIAVLWSSYVQILSELLLRLYEINLSKSIATIPELLQRRWQMYRLRVDMPEAFQLSFAPRQSGNEGSTSNEAVEVDAVVLGKPVNIYKDRVIVIDGHARRTTSRGTRKEYTDNYGVTVQGTRISVGRTIPGGLKHVYWWSPTGVARFDTETVFDLRCVAGDLLALDLRLGESTAQILCRVYGVTQDGYVGFEITRGALSDVYSYKDSAGEYKTTEVLNQIIEAFTQLGLDTNVSYREAAIRFMDLILLGRDDYIEQEFGITFVPRHILRLSQFAVDEAAVSVPYLQSAVQNPTFILNQNEDFLLQEDERGKFLQLADNVVLDEFNLPRAVWAEVVFLDNAEAIENNFGILVGGERDKLPERVTDHTMYRGAVEGLMYAFASGPTPDNIRLGVQIVLGLPFTSNRCIIRLVDSSYTDTEGLIITEDVDSNDTPTGFQRIHKYPLAATLEENEETGQTIKIGDILPRFFPLCSGVEVLDWVNSPEWWGPLYDGQVSMPQYHEAFFDHGWNPESQNLIPDAAMVPFQEPQKVHVFEVRLDPDVFNAEDAIFANRFVRGVNQTWRLGLEKKGIRPHYTYPLLIVRQKVSEQLTVRDRARITITHSPVDDITGYEASLREGHNNSLSNAALYQDAPMRFTMWPQEITITFVPPVVDSTTQTGAVRVEVHKLSGPSFSVGENVTNGLITAEVLAIEEWPSVVGRHDIQSLLLSYNTDNTLFGPNDTLTGATSGAEGIILNESCVEVSFNISLIEDNYPFARYRDILLVDSVAPFSGRYGIFAINPLDEARLLIYQLRSDNVTHQPPLPYGISDPNGNSSYRPALVADRTAWQDYAEEIAAVIERPFHNPIHCPELFLGDPTLSTLSVVAAGAGIHEASLSTHIHRDGLKAGHTVVFQAPAEAEHLGEYEIVRDTDGSDIEAINDFDKWEIGTVTPGLFLSGGAISSPTDYVIDVYDSRLPFKKYMAGSTLPSQAGATVFAIILPAVASYQDDAYEGMYFRALSGAGAWLTGGTQVGHWEILSYNGTTKKAVVKLPHANVFDATTVFEIVSFIPADHAIIPSIVRETFPSDPIQLQTWAAVKAGDPNGGAPSCILGVTSGSAVMVATNMAQVRPAGKDFLTANGGGDAPFVTGIVTVGDIVVLSAISGATAAEKRLASQQFVVTGNILADRFDVSPTPSDSSTTGLYFTIYRASPTIVTDVSYP